MYGKTASIILLSLLVVSALALAYKVQPVRASGTIVIRADGSIDPPDAPIITADNITYTLTNNIRSDAEYAVTIERDNIIVDGAGYTLQGTGETNSKGLYLYGRRNVAIRNMEIELCDVGIMLYTSRSIEIRNNCFINTGIFLCPLAASEDISYYSTHIIEGNTVNGKPLYYYSNTDGVKVPEDAGSVIVANCTNITVEHLNAHGTLGVEFAYTQNSTISSNVVLNSWYGIYLHDSHYDNISNNSARNSIVGIYLDHSGNNNVLNNSLSNHYVGIRLGQGACCNNITRNWVSNSSWGIYISDRSECNKIYHNYFVENLYQVHNDPSTPSTNTWDDGYPSGGNYWSDYTDVDLYKGPCQNETGGDDIWDHPYVMDVGNQDNYPLVNSMNWTPPESQPPTCVIRLQKDGVQISEVYVREFFDIYVGDSTGDAAIVQVRFSVDDSQDGVPTGEWTNWYNWNQNSGNWSALNKTMNWSFATGGRKEVWAMIEDSDGNVEWNHTDTFINPGYAIVVAGSGLFKVTLDHCANNAYRVLRNLGFDDDHIFYLNSQDQDIDGDGNSEVDGVASFSWFMYAMDTAKGKIDGSPIPLILYFVGHGVPDAFILDGSQDLGVETLREKLNEFSSETPMLIVINSCYSGSFITPTYPGQSISAQNRIIITSTENDQKREAFTWIRFSDRLWGNLDKAFNVKDAFTSRATWGDNSHSWLDDNGDKIGHPPDNLGDDGNLASTTYIGVPGTEDLTLEPWQFGWKHSPGELRLYDSQNRVTGMVDGEVKAEIPNSIYFEQDEFIMIFPPFDTYHYEVVGRETGAYGLDIGSIDGGEAVAFTAIDIPTSITTIHQYTINWTALSQGEEGVTVMADSNGDGVVEYNFTSDAELTRTEYVFATTKHDIEITGMTTEKSVIGQDYNMLINLTIVNYGPYVEIFNVASFVNATSVTSQTIVLEGGNFTTLTFNWNTTGFAKGNYALSAYAEPVPGETNTADNNFTGGWVKITIVGDVNGDGKVNLIDVFAVALAYGSYPGHLTWNPNYDINNDGKINLIDYFITALNYGKTDS